MDKLLAVIKEHREDYDLDCGWHGGCNCGEITVPNRTCTPADRDAYAAHLAEKIAAVL